MGLLDFRMKDYETKDSFVLTYSVLCPKVYSPHKCFTLYSQFIRKFEY